MRPDTRAVLEKARPLSGATETDGTSLSAQGKPKFRGPTEVDNPRMGLAAVQIRMSVNIV